MPLPTEIIGLLRSTVTFVWEDDHRSIYPARDLRLRCRCAMCIEEMTGRPLLDPGKIDGNVRARQMEIMGQYAVRIEWSDGHSTGIYNFRDLRANCPCETCVAERAAAKTS